MGIGFGYIGLCNTGVNGYRIRIYIGLWNTGVNEYRIWIYRPMEYSCKWV